MAEKLDAVEDNLWFSRLPVWWCIRKVKRRRKGQRGKGAERPERQARTVGHSQISPTLRINKLRVDVKITSGKDDDCLCMTP